MNPKFLYAKISDMYYYLIPILNKKPDYNMLHVGTNDVVETETIVIAPVEIFCKRGNT